MDSLLLAIFPWESHIYFLIYSFMPTYMIMPTWFLLSTRYLFLQGLHIAHEKITTVLIWTYPLDPSTSSVKLGKFTSLIKKIQPFPVSSINFQLLAPYLYRQKGSCCTMNWISKLIQIKNTQKQRWILASISFKYKQLSWQKRGTSRVRDGGYLPSGRTRKPKLFQLLSAYKMLQFIPG